MSKFSSYFDPKTPSSFTGLNSFKKTIKKDKGLKEWMIDQEPYTLHKPKRKKFKRQKVISNGIDDLWQADLVDVSKISKDNCFKK